MREKTKGIITKIFNVLSLMILIASVATLGYVTVTKLMGKTPQIFGYSLHFVVSASMEPDIMVGDFVIGKKTTPEQLYKDNLTRAEADKDTILFVSPDPSDDGIIIVHKIRDITKTDDGYQIHTYGINNPSDDNYPTTEVIGKVVVVSSTLGKIFSPMSVVFAILILTILTIFYLSLKSFLKSYKTLKAQEQTTEAETTNGEIAEAETTKEESTKEETGFK